MSVSRGLSDPAAHGAIVASDLGADGSEGSWITFLSHRSGGNLLYRMRPDGSEVTPIFGGELRGVPGLSEGQTLYRQPHWSRQSPDRTLFLSWANDVSSPEEKYPTAVRYMIHLGRTDGGPTRVLAPDGKKSSRGPPAPDDLPIRGPPVPIHDRSPGSPPRSKAPRWSSSGSMAHMRRSSSRNPASGASVTGRPTVRGCSCSTAPRSRPVSDDPT